MRTKSLLIGTLWVVSTLAATAQKKLFTITEATNGMSTTLAPASVKKPSWQPNTDKLWQATKSNGADVWTVTDYSQDSRKTMTVQPGEYPEKMAAMPDLKWLDKNTAYALSGTTVLLATLADNQLSWKTLAKLPEKAEHITVHKNRNIAYTIENNLWLWQPDKGATQVTHETNPNVLCGQPVHRDEFGIDRGIFFSPSGNYLAYYRMDQSMVADYPIIRWGNTPATVDNIKYPMAGGTSHQVTLCVYSPAIGTTTTLKTGDREKDQYLTAVTWAPDERSIYLALLNRDQNHLWLNRYNARTGARQATLLEETSKKYVHPTHALTFLPWNENTFVWWSERDGYDHLYLYQTDGKLIRRLTSGNWVVNELVGMNEANHQLIITAAKESPIEKHSYTVNTDDARMNRIDHGAGMHNALCSSTGRYLLDVYTGAGIPKNSIVRGTNHSFASELIKATDPLEAYDRPEIKDVTLKAADGYTTLYGKLILPLHFDKTKKYPVIVYLYNGPNVQLIHNSFPESGNLWYEYMAQRGYIVFTMDGRGSWNRGLDFEQATFRKLGEVEIKDQMKGVDYLKSLPYVDASRMGIHGWSYGGFMTTSLMLKQPGTFACGVAGGPVMDWKLYEVMYTERYMDNPATNPQGYAASNLLDKVKDLKGKLMLIHGTDDNVVVWQHSINFLKKCVDEGVQVDYFVYPGYEHNVRGKDRIHLMQKITDYFDQYLKP